LGSIPSTTHTHTHRVTPTIHGETKVPKTQLTQFSHQKGKQIQKFDLGDIKILGRDRFSTRLFSTQILQPGYRHQALNTLRIKQEDSRWSSCYCFEFLGLRDWGRWVAVLSWAPTTLLLFLIHPDQPRGAVGAMGPRVKGSIQHQHEVDAWLMLGEYMNEGMRQRKVNE
jgi:hypothetical protein